MRTVLICSPANASPDIHLHARAAAMRAFRLVATGWQITVCRRDAIAPTVVETCRQFGIPCEVMPSQRRALSGADRVVAFDRVDVIRQAMKRRIPGWLDGVAIPVQLPLPLVVDDF